MYIGIDFGGTKTLAAAFTDDGQISKKHKFQTDGSYQEYLEKLQQELTEHLGEAFEQAPCVTLAVPTRVDYDTGKVRLGPKMGDGWGHESIRTDLEQRFSKKVIIENDANVAALGEALHGAGQGYSRVLYVTLSTGIGTGYVENGGLDQTLLRSEGGQMIVSTPDGTLAHWEDIASGKAFTERYGKMGSEVDNPAIWREYARLLAPGFVNLMALVQPEVIVIGGGMGAHLEKFREFVEPAIEDLRDERVDPVQLISASIPDEAVIYGCYELARQQETA